VPKDSVSSVRAFSYSWDYAIRNRDLVKVKWTEDASIYPQSGHGLDFCSGERRTSESLVAVLRGFGWLREPADEVQIRIRPPDDHHDEAYLAQARQEIEEFMQHPIVRPGPVSATLRVWPNA